MNWIIFKYLLTAGMVVLISEIAKRSDRLGGLIAALPLVTVLTLSWLYIENQSSKNCKSCLLHFLVCITDTTNVFNISLFIKKIWFLDYLIFKYDYYFSSILYLCKSGQAFWNRTFIKKILIFLYFHIFNSVVRILIIQS